jgi:hypothetical protein
MIVEAILNMDRQRDLFKKMDAIQFPPIVVKQANLAAARQWCEPHLFSEHKREVEELNRDKIEEIIDNLAYWRLTHKKVFAALRVAGTMQDLKDLFEYEPNGRIHEDACPLFLQMAKKESPLKDVVLRAQMQKLFVTARQAVVLK